MSFMAQIKLKYVNSFYDRHGKLRHLFRYPGITACPAHPTSWTRINPRSPALVSNRSKSVQSERWLEASMLPS
jgi:hypothetical protein